MKIIFGAVIILALLSSLALWKTLSHSGPASKISKSILEEYAAWNLKYGKLYATPAEANYRLQVFSETVSTVIDLNEKYTRHVAAKGLAELSGPMFELNQFADITNEEFRATHTGLTVREHMPIDDLLVPSNLEESEPTKYLGADQWKLNVRNQQNCGSCWAQAAIATVEKQYHKKTGKQVQFSVQELVDCDKGNTGCLGGWPDIAMEYIKKNGISLESNYPYMFKETPCKTDVSRVEDVKSMLTPSRHHFSMQKLRRLLAGGNYVATTMLGDGVMRLMSSFDDVYDSSFMADCGSIKANHGVTIIEAGTGWLRILNSYGTGWGHMGTKKIKPCTDNLILGSPAFLFPAQPN